MDGYNRHRLALAIVATFALTAMVLWLIFRPSRVVDWLSLFGTALGPTYLSDFALRTRLWRIRPISMALGRTTENIDGRWIGYILSTHTGMQQRHCVAVEVLQGLDTCEVSYYDNNATHRSIVAAVRPSPTGQSELHEIYLNTPGRVGLRMHHGTMRVGISRGGTVMAGRYYNDPSERSSVGEIYLEKTGGPRQHCPPDPAEELRILDMGGDNSGYFKPEA